MTGDTKYGTVEHIVAIESPDIRAYVPLSEAGHRSGRFRDTDFIYDAADAYRCPAGQSLGFLTRCHPTRRRIYAAAAHLRRVGRSRDAADLERVRDYHGTEDSARAMRKRTVWVRPRFAEAKDWQGLRRFRRRGLANVTGEALLIAAGQNLKRLRTQQGWGRRPFPNGAAGRVLPPLPRPLAVAP